MAPSHGEELPGVRRIYLDAGRGDEYFLDLGAQAFSAELSKLGVDAYARSCSTVGTAA